MGGGNLNGCLNCVVSFSLHTKLCVVYKLYKQLKMVSF